MIEIMAVIAIILILMSLFFGGMKMWQASQARQLTVNRLQILSSAFGELEAAGHNTFQQQWFIAGLYYNGAIQPAALDASQFGNVSTAQTAPAQESIMVNGAQQALNPAGYSSREYALQYMSFPMMTTSTTQIYGLATVKFATPAYTYPAFTSYMSPPAPYGLMGRLMSLPTAAKAISSLPSTAVTNGTYPAYGTTTASAPVVLDGWGNPILFVPSGGLGNVYLKTSTSNWLQVTNTSGATTLTNAPIVSPDGRPFFVSAGPDGDFLKGDDNVYSFEAQ
jgi:type II secretory pathway pseudopilin PulG